MKNIQLNLSFNPLNSFTSMLFLTIIFVTSCGISAKPDHTKNGNEKGNNKKTTMAEAVVSTPFPAKLAMYNQLFKNPDCDDTNKIFGITGPINCAKLKAGIIEFHDHYQNIDTSKDIDFYPSEVIFDGFYKNLFETLGKQNEFGLVFHYGYYKGSRKIVYLLSKGTLDANLDIAFQPFGNSENGQTIKHYIAFTPHNGNAYKIVNQTVFDELTCDYKNKVKFKGEIISTINNKPQGDHHPLMTYHAPKEFLDFCNFYNSSTSSNTLYISHGSLKSDGVAVPKHTPCFVFGKNNSFFDLDNQIRTGPNRFKNQALDIGRLCPPNCPTPVLSCPSN